MQIVTFSADGAAVTGYLQEDHPRLVHHKTRPALIVCPGGGYNHICPREGDPAALPFLAQGYQVFLLSYSVAPDAGGCRPLRQLAQTVVTLRDKAEEWHIESHHIAVLGFSAGGHLAASLATLWDDPELHLDPRCRPDAAVLAYPVITTGEYAHRESADNVSGGDAALRDKLSLERRVKPTMPPTFVWHCVGDESVPVENTLLLVTAMQRSGVDYECHLFAGGAHGISVCTQETETPTPACAPWVSLCQTWLNERFHYIP